MSDAEQAKEDRFKAAERAMKMTPEELQLAFQRVLGRNVPFSGLNPLVSEYRNQAERDEEFEKWKAEIEGSLNK